MIFLFLFQSWIYLTLIKKKINFSIEHCIDVSLFCVTLAIAYITEIQHLIYMTDSCFSHSLKCLAENILNDVFVELQTSTYVFLEWAEILAIVSDIKLAYSQVSASMKSIIQTLFNLFSVLSSLFNVDVSFVVYDFNMIIVYESIIELLLFVTFAFEFVYLVRDKVFNWTRKFVISRTYCK